MVRARPFYNPMSFASELQEAGYIDRPGGGNRPPPSKPERPRPRPGDNQIKPPGNVVRPPGNIVRPPGRPIKPRYNNVKDKASLGQQRLAGNQGKRMGGRTPVFAKGYQYGARDGRGGRIPVFDQADLARRLKWRESNKYIGERLTPFVPRGS